MYPKFIIMVTIYDDMFFYEIWQTILLEYEQIV